MKRLDELTIEMSGLCFELEHTESLTTEERTSLEDRADSVTEDLQMQFGTITTVFGPEVSRETQSMYFALQKFLLG